MTPMRRLCPLLLKTPLLNPRPCNSLRRLSSSPPDKEWNEAWESAWLPDISPQARAPWESDVHFSPPSTPSPDMDPDTQAFVQDMDQNWEQRKGRPKPPPPPKTPPLEDDPQTRKLDALKTDYRLKKQRIHAALWLTEVQKQEEAKLGHSSFDGDNIDNLFHSADQIFDSTSDPLNNSEKSNSELKNKPDGWETLSKAEDGNVWEMSQREEDILLQEFERRLAFNKSKIASFVKTHIFSRRRPIDGWKYMIEEIGPNARRGQGSASRSPNVADEATRPYREERRPDPERSSTRPRVQMPRHGTWKIDL